MDKAALEQQILGFFATTFEEDVSTLSRDTSIRDELSPKSMLMVSLVALIENELDVMISLPEASQMKTIGDMIDKVEELL